MAELVAFRVSHWGTDPWSRGSWSHLGPRARPVDRVVLGSPAHPRLILAGEAAHSSMPATTHGAYDSGRHAARWCLAQGRREVAVVGAGFAGLGAARTLADMGAAVTVLEARDRVGGRAHTVELGGVHVDLGAAWLQQEQANSLAGLARRLGLRTVRTDFHAPRVATAATLLPATTAEILRRLLALAPATDDHMSLADRLAPILGSMSDGERHLAELALEAEVVIESGVGVAELSGRYALDEPGTGLGDLWLPGGYLQLLDHLAAGLRVRVGAPVTGVRVTPSEVRLSGGWGELRAEAAIVTVPISVLPWIEFNPPLPAPHRLAMTRLGTGVVEKVLLCFDARFWPIAPTGYFRWLNEPDIDFVEWIDLSDALGVPIVAALSGGPAVSRLFTERDDHTVARSACDALTHFARAAH